MKKEYKTKVNRAGLDPNYNAQADMFEMLNGNIIELDKTITKSNSTITKLTWLLIVVAIIQLLLVALQLVLLVISSPDLIQLLKNFF